MTAAEIAQALDELGHERKAVQRPAAERLAEAARNEPALRARIAPLLTSENPRARWGAAFALAQLEPAPLDAVPVLLEALGSSDGDVRWAAARLVVRAVGHAAAVGDDVRRLLSAPSALQRKMALYCLRDLAATNAVDAGAIATALGDDDVAVRLAAMSAAVVLLPRTAETAERLVPLVDDPEPGVRRAAAAVLGQLGVSTPVVEACLDRALASPDEMLARVARQALSRLAGGSASNR